MAIVLVYEHSYYCMVTLFILYEKPSTSGSFLYGRDAFNGHTEILWQAPRRHRRADIKIRKVDSFSTLMVAKDLVLSTWYEAFFLVLFFSDAITAHLFDAMPGV